MADGTIRVLHVEDDEVQRRLVARYLATEAGSPVAVAYAANEDEAVEEFRRDGADAVVLDYHLTHGNGLSCLRRLRQLDGCVPVIAVSGVATAEVAAELVRAGADDYISKTDLAPGVLGRSLREALLRANACRVRTGGGDPTAEAGALVRELCQQFAAAVGPEFVGLLDRFEAAVVGAGLTAAQVERLFEGVCGDLERVRADGGVGAVRMLRPVLLEMLLRLADGTRRKTTDAAPAGPEGITSD